MANADMFEIDPRGDVVLICGKGSETTKLRVSSPFITFRSDVMKAMMGPHFKEGHTLAATSRIEIQLPDDDGQAMKTICCVLHQRNSLVPDKLTPREILKVAVLVDKYNWCEALKVNVWFWVNQHLETAGNADRCNLLLVSYLLQNSELFQRLGNDVMLHVSRDFRFDQRDCPEVMNKVFDEIFRKAKEISTTERDFIEDEVNDESVGNNVNTGSSTRGGEMLKRLRDSGLWPSKTRERRTLSQDLQAMRTAKFDFSVGTSTAKGFSYDESGETFATKRTARFKTKAQELESEIKSLCLQCVQEGKILHGVCAHKGPLTRN